MCLKSEIEKGLKRLIYLNSEQSRSYNLYELSIGNRLASTALEKLGEQNVDVRLVKGWQSLEETVSGDRIWLS